jgi:hypothetical protein
LALILFWPYGPINAPNSAPFILFADPDFMAERAHELGLQVTLHICEPEEAAGFFHHALPISPLTTTVAQCCGLALSDNAGAVVDSLEKAVQSVLKTNVVLWSLRLSKKRHFMKRVLTLKDILTIYRIRPCSFGKSHAEPL